VTKRSRGHELKRHAGSPALDPDEFPCLRVFVRGYLHEDFVQVHGSPLAAATAFCGDASPEERERLNREIAALVEMTEGGSPRAPGRFLTESLGSHWAPRSTDELRALRAVILTTR